MLLTIEDILQSKLEIWAIKPKKTKTNQNMLVLRIGLIVDGKCYMRNFYMFENTRLQEQLEEKMK